MKTLKLTGQFLKPFRVFGWYCGDNYDAGGNPDRCTVFRARDESHAEDLADAQWNRTGHKCAVIVAEEI